MERLPIRINPHENFSMRIGPLCDDYIPGIPGIMLKNGIALPGVNSNRKEVPFHATGSQGFPKRN